MMRLFVILASAITFMATIGEASKCNPDIIKNIREKFWNKGACVPRDIIRTGEFLGPKTVVRTTKDFFENEDEVSCGFTVFKGSLVQQFLQYNHGPISQEPTSEVTVVEEGGAVIDKDTQSGTYRYYLYVSNFGVRALYRCSDTEEEGDPEAVLTVSRHWYDRQALAQAVEDLALLGITLSDKVYSESCAP